MNKKLEKILGRLFIAGSIAVGGLMLGTGLYRDGINEKYPGKYQDTITLKYWGLVFCASGMGLSLSGKVKKDDKYFLSQHK